MKGRGLFAGLVAIGVAGGCWRIPLDDPDRLLGREWTLVALQRRGGDVATVPLRDAFTVDFEGDGRLAVRADCNRCSGGYEAEDGRLRVSELACTRAYCPATAPFDTEYVAQLGAARHYLVDRRTLTVDTRNGLLVFER